MSRMLPSSEDLDALAEEERIKMATSGIPHDAPVPSHIWPIYGGIPRMSMPALEGFTKDGTR